jgi:GT2 family glycosyltransferase
LPGSPSIGTPEPPPGVAIVIVSWNVRELLLACLTSLRAGSAPARVVVVDNNSSDGSRAAVEATFPDVEWIQNSTNPGFAAANNQALRRLGVLAPAGAGPEGAEAGAGTPPAAPEFVVFLNPDTVIAPGAIEVLVDALRSHPRAAVTGPRLLYPDGRPQPSRRSFPDLGAGLMESTPLEWHWPGNPWAARFRMAGTEEKPGPVDWLSGAALAARSDALREVAGFDDGFFMYSEETDLCRRLADAGWETRYVPEAVVFHHEGGSSEQNVRARHLAFYRSRVRYFAKHRGRASGATVRVALLAQFALEAVLEAAKYGLGHKRGLRRERLSAYRAILADGLRVPPPASPAKPLSAHGGGRAA